MRQTRKVKRTEAERAASAADVVIYARVSSREQEREGYSIPAQLELLRSYAAARGLRVVKEYVDVESAKRAGRSGFVEMVRFLRAGAAVERGCRTVLVEKTDRLYRNFKDYVTVDELGVEVHLVKEGQTLSAGSKSAEKFMHGIKVLMAKNYLDNLSEEVIKGMREKARQGVIPARAPQGYVNTQESGRRFVALDPRYAPAIRQMFELYATGEHSLKDLARIMHGVGLGHPKTGRRHRACNIHWILTNPVYYGAFQWDGEMYQGTHEPIVSRDLFEAVQAVMARKQSRGKRSQKHEWAFAGLVQCGHCGCALSAQRKKGIYVYYRCTGYKGKCPEPSVREEALSAAFGQALGAVTLEGEVLEWIVRALKESHGDVSRSREETIARLQCDRTRIVNRLDALYIDKLDGRIPPELFERKTDEWNAELDQIRRKIAAHEGASRSYMEDGARLLELAQRAVTLYEKQEMAEKRRLLGFVVSNSTWRDGRLAVEYRQPFNLIAETKQRRVTGAGDNSLARAEHLVWSALLDDFRTLFAAPPPELVVALEQARTLLAA